MIGVMELADGMAGLVGMPRQTPAVVFVAVVPFPEDEDSGYERGAGTDPAPELVALSVQRVAKNFPEELQ